MTDDVQQLKRALARAQAFNAEICNQIAALIVTTETRGAPNAVTLIAACEHALREAYRAGERAV